jgi:hypothetical protein
MYKIRNKVYADAGKILKGNNQIGYFLTGELNDFTESDILLDDMSIKGQYLVYNNGIIVEMYDPSSTYEQLKTKIIKRVFSNDDQIAIILNKDDSEDDLMVYNKM